MDEKEPTTYEGASLPQPGLPLQAIPHFPRERARQLASFWVNTAEEFISMASTPRGRAGLADLLEVSQEELDALLQMVAAHLPEEVAEELAQPTKKQHPLGAILYDEEPSEEAEDCP